MPAREAFHSREREIIEPEKSFDVRVCKGETLADAQTIEPCLQCRQTDLVLIHVHDFMMFASFSSSAIVLTLPQLGATSPLPRGHVHSAERRRGWTEQNAC